MSQSPPGDGSPTRVIAVFSQKIGGTQSASLSLTTRAPIVISHSKISRLSISHKIKYVRRDSLNVASPTDCGSECLSEEVAGRTFFRFGRPEARTILRRPLERLLILPDEVDYIGKLTGGEYPIAKPRTRQRMAERFILISQFYRKIWFYP